MRFGRRLAATLAAAVIAGSTVLVSGSAAHADDYSMPIWMPLAGTATVAKQNATLNLPAGGRLDGAITFHDAGDASINADMTVPEFEAHIRLLGIPGIGDTTSTVRLVPTEQTTAHITDMGVITGVTKFRMEIPRVTPDFFPWLNIVRPGCKTGEITVNLTSPEPFLFVEPQPMDGTFTIPAFEGCGFSFFGINSGRDALLTGLLSGPGNELDLMVGPAYPV